MKSILIIVACCFFGTASLAQDNSVEDVISDQIEALLKDDFAKAFSFASPMIKEMFQNPTGFGEMVKRGYPMVWRPSQVTFGPLQTVDGVRVQTVFLTDQGGRVFEASYEMIEVENSWKINGVTIKEIGLGA